MKGTIAKKLQWEVNLHFILQQTPTIAISNQVCS